MKKEDRVQLPDVVFVNAGLNPVYMKYNPELHYYRYGGDSCHDYVAMAQLVMRHGYKYFDPVTGRPCGCNRVRLTEGLVETVLSWYVVQKVTGKGWLEFTEDMLEVSDHARGIDTNYNYSVHFGLAEKKHENGKTYYRLTERGRRFCEGLDPSPTDMDCCGTTVIRFVGEGKMIDNILPEHKVFVERWTEALTEC